MANLKRYNITDSSMYHAPEIDEDKNGEWVKFEDIKELLKTPTNTARDAMLRECAHCGGEPDLAVTKSMRFEIERYECFCFNCGFSTGKHELMEDAVLTWNARPENKEEKFYSRTLL